MKVCRLSNVGCLILLLLHGVKAIGSDSFDENDCRKLAFFIEQVSIPSAIVYASSIKIKPQPTNDAESNYLRLKYPKPAEVVYEEIHFSHLKNHKLKSINDVVNHWGLVADFDYWGAIEYALDYVERQQNLACAEGDKVGKLDVAVLAQIAPEIFPSKREAAMIVVKSMKRDFYYLVSKELSGKYAIDLKIKMNDDIYLMQVKGMNREALELFVQKVIVINR